MVSESAGATRPRYILGIDAGTTSVKSVAFRLDGTIASVARSTLRIERGDDGRAEANMNHVWDATVSTIVAVVEALGDADVVAIGITGQGDGAWFVDGRMQPLGNAALWLDGRPNARLTRWLADGRAQAVHQATGSPLFAGALPVLLEELVTADPELMASIAFQLNCKDWLRYKLTGHIATDPSEASRTYLDTGTGAYSLELLEALGQSDFLNRLPVVEAPESIGAVLNDHASLVVGLPAGIPVVVGLVDTVAAGVGLGAVADGDGFAILGTTGFVGVNRASRVDVTHDATIVLSTGRGVQVLESFAPMAGTPNLDWVRDSLGFSSEQWPEVEARASKVLPGSGGVTYLPYGAPSGERAPFFDPAASATWMGMSVTTTASELLRSVYEGIAYSLTECLDDLGVHGDLPLCGGGSDSDLLCAILADVSGRRVIRQDEPEVGARGVASLAMIALGYASDLEDAVAKLAPRSTVFEPNVAHASVYAGGYETFIAARNALRPIWPALRGQRARSSSLGSAQEGT